MIENDLNNVDILQLQQDGVPPQYFSPLREFSDDRFLDGGIGLSDPPI